MKSKYWIKLYHEMLDDPKMGRLPDRLYRRTIETFLLAGDSDQDGFLPSLAEIAWRLHLGEEELETDLIELQRIGILDVIEGRWFVAKFAERQAADSDTERWRRWKERQRKGDYYPAQPSDPVSGYTNGIPTSDQRTANDTSVDIEIDKEVEEIESEAEAAVEAAGAADFTELVEILHAAGIYEPTATQITEMPHITQPYLEAKIAEAVEDGVNTKILITRLRNNDPPPLTPQRRDELDRQRYAVPGTTH